MVVRTDRGGHRADVFEKSGRRASWSPARGVSEDYQRVLDVARHHVFDEEPAGSPAKAVEKLARAQINVRHTATSRTRTTAVVITVAEADLSRALRLMK